MITVENVSKTFTLYNQNSATLAVLQKASLQVDPGECVALTGVSGSGKSTLMRMIYGNYLAASGTIRIGDLDIVTAEPHAILQLRRHTLGYVSQFLRVVPRVSALDVVAEPLLTIGTPYQEAIDQAKALLERLRIPKSLWPLSPLTFSGGEQQRVNIARGFIYGYPALLVDEPTASLDGPNRDTVLALIEEAKKEGAAILGIFHDADARACVCDREINVSEFKP